ncbi:MlaD family protein [Enterovirga rhinocerotis]|uniref:Phospholipid/cholesterol/gamma-HCH transport system substrate-binding protein n=1 Tax=Enterovirga rhinocerotis TaxID=1339210 RepID=A0A4R7CBJ0_9HYPH|nr:MlaD family protein [Enterovirga rhinocerotis]TDR94456.1 phospholipid/cholesterol/gamma-HCH transport system substrate-binding protein [Enterovirga rhinocerotis]
METRANYALIGLFTIAVLGAAFGFVYWFAGTESGKDRPTYRIEFSGSVAGLSKGSPVLFNGIRVGDVQSVELSETAPDQAFATIQVAKTTPIRDDTRASLDVNLLSGVAQIALMGGAHDAPALQKRHPDDPYPTITAEPGGLGSIIQSAKGAVERANVLLDTLNSVIGDNRGSINASIKNFEVFSEALGKNAPQLDRLIASVAEAATQIGPVAAKLGSLTDDATSVVRSVEPERVRQIVRNVDSASGRLDGVLKAAESFLGSAAGEEGKSTFASIRTAMDAFQRASDNLSRRATEIATAVSRLSATGSRQVDSLGADARRAVNTIGRAAGNLERNPSSVIFGTGRAPIPEYSGR